MTTGRRLALTFGVILQAAPGLAIEVTRGPYLQLVTSTSATVVWRTDVAATCSLAIAPTGGAARVLAGDSSTTCVIAVDGLTPGTAYEYVPRADGAALEAPSTFRTDDPAAPFLFAVIGDHGDNIETSQREVRDQLLAMAPDFVLSTGDMIYPSGDPEDFDPKFFAPYEALLRRVVFWPCLGNHDVEADGGESWRAAFYTPANNPAQAEDFYSFAWGNTHVLVIDSTESTSPGSRQHTFVEQDLSASTAKWKVAAFHHTMYSSGGSGGSARIAANLAPLFDRYRVDVVFAGHDHDYERTLPMYDGEVVEPGDGTVYITTGGGGANVHSVGRSAFTAYSERSFHAVRVTVAGDTLRAEMVRADGVVRDSVVLTKGGAACGPTGCCESVAQCDDQEPCTLDSCRVSGLCRHLAVDLDDVRATVARAGEAQECEDDEIPPRISLPIQRAKSLLDRSGSVSRPGRRAQLIGLAARRLERAARRADRAAERGRISQACAAALGALVTEAHFECID